MNYFVMVGEGVYPSVSIEKEPDLGAPWFSGTKVEGEVPNPLIFTCEKRRDEIGTPKHLYAENATPIMSAELRAALTAAGIDNIEYFPAILRDPKTKKEFTNYFAFNIVGAVAAADMGKSKLMGTSDSTMLDADFDSLVIDPDSARGMLLFRLAENLSAIITHESVKEVVEKREIPGIIFYAPEDWAG